MRERKGAGSQLLVSSSHRMSAIIYLKRDVEHEGACSYLGRNHLSYPPHDSASLTHGKPLSMAVISAFSSCSGMNVDGWVRSLMELYRVPGKHHFFFVPASWICCVTITSHSQLSALRSMKSPSAGSAAPRVWQRHTTGYTKMGCLVHGDGLFVDFCSHRSVPA